MTAAAAAAAGRRYCLRSRFLWPSWQPQRRLFLFQNTPLQMREEETAAGGNMLC
jgi:hypothetical protein